MKRIVPAKLWNKKLTAKKRQQIRNRDLKRRYPADCQQMCIYLMNVINHSTLASSTKLVKPLKK